MEGVKKMESDFSQWDPVKGQDATGTNSNTRNNI